MRRWTKAVAVLAAVLTLGGCAGLPTTSGVNPGLSADQVPDRDEDVDFLPGEPQKGASPQQIVEGFIEAATSPASDWGIARMFLTDAFSDQWQPSQNVWVSLMQPSYSFGEEGMDSRGTVTIEPTATLDATGAYATGSDGTLALEFGLVQQADGEWRIEDAPDWIVLDRPVFTRVFDPYPIMYFDPTWHYLVPDIRWFAKRKDVASNIVRALTGKPTPWLEGSVVTAFSDDVAVAPGVPIDTAHVAHVEVDGSAGLDETTLSRMQLQLTASLAAAGASSVELSSSGAVLDIPAISTRSTTVDGRALVRTEDGVGYLDGGDFTPLEGFSEVIGTLEEITALQLSAAKDAAVVQTTPARSCA
ncbi:hypothetical protein [Microbacterium lacticum]